MENLQEILIAYIPAVSVLLGFLASCIGVIKKLKNANLEMLRDEIKDDNSELRKELRNATDMLLQLAQENYELKEQNRKLISELTRIAAPKEE